MTQGQYRATEYSGVVAFEFIGGIRALEVSPPRSCCRVRRFQLSSNGAWLKILKGSRHSSAQGLPEAYARNVRVALKMKNVSNLNPATRQIEKEDAFLPGPHNRIGGTVGLSQAALYSPHTCNDARRPSGFPTNDGRKRPQNVPCLSLVRASVMSSALAKYETFLLNNVSVISSLESSLRSVTWILPGRFKDAELASEACTYYNPCIRNIVSHLSKWLRC